LSKTKTNLESLYDKTGSIYKLVVLASRRALELNAGAAQLTQEQKENIIETALQEIAEGKVGFKLQQS
jgi:DNA-directed RNA polymerase omega subunit